MTYVNLQSVGPTGPPGPTGPIGPTGSTGPIGPNGPPSLELGLGPAGANLLTEFGDFTPAQILAGMDSTLYPNVGSLPTPPASGLGIPAFAWVEPTISGQLPRFAYYNFVDDSGWLVTTHPWDNPILLPEDVILVDNIALSGPFTYNFAMGPIFRILSPIPTGLRITEGKIRFGGVAADHAWSLRRSTVTGVSLPAASTFTDVIASGTISHPGGGASVSIPGFGGPYTVADDEWYWLGVWQGTSQGHFWTLSSERALGNIQEDYAQCAGSFFVSVSGPAPGNAPVPVNTSTNTMYGIATIRLDPT